MILPALALFALAALAPSGQKAHGDAIARLASADTAERAAAQRWLAARLTWADRALIEASLKAADPETCGRWIEILASEDRLLHVAASCAAAADESQAAVGRAALRGAILRWSPTAARPGLSAGELSDALGTWTWPRLEVDMTLAKAPLEDVLDLCTAVTSDPVGFAVEARPDAASAAQTGAASVGSLASVLREFALRHDLFLLGFACGEDDPPGARWLAFVPKPPDALESPSALDLLERWSMEFARPGDARVRSSRARALAASGWTGGIALLEGAFVVDGDAAALDGLMLAARRGRVAPALVATAGQARLRAEVARHVAANDARGALAAARALGATGVRGAAGEELHLPLLEEIATASGLALFTRLVELDERRPRDAATKAALDLLLVREDVPIGARFLAIEARARFAAPLEGLGHAQDCVEFAARSGRLPELARWLRGARSFPPEAWRDPAYLPANWTFAMRAFVVGAWLARGETRAAVDHVVQALKRSDAVERETLAEAVGQVARGADPTAAEALFAGLEASTEVERARLSRFIVLAGGNLSAASLDEVLASVPQPVLEREDWLVLGALAASARGPAVRTRLVEALGGAESVDDLMAGLARAVAGLRSKREFDLEREFENSVRASAGGRSPRLRGLLRIGRWPAPPEEGRVRLGLWDRSALRFGL